MRRFGLLSYVGPLLGLVLIAAGLFLNFRFTGEGADDGQTFTEQAKMADRFVDSVGLSTHLGSNLWNGTFDTIYMPRVKELGLRHIREDFGNHGQYLDALKKISDAGIKLDMIIARDAESQTHLPTINEALVEINTYLGMGIKLGSVEGPNEYNHPRLYWDNQPPPAEWPRWLFEFTRDFANSFRSDSRYQGIEIFSPTYINYGAGDLLKQQGPFADYVDYGNYHWYCNDYWSDNNPADLSNFCNYDQHYQAFAAPLYSGKTIIITENGIPSTDNVAGAPVEVQRILLSEDVAAKYTSRRLLELFNRGIKRTYLYQLYVAPDIPNNTLTYYMTLLKTDGAAKQPFTALKNLIALANDPGPQFTPATLTYRLAAPTTLKRVLMQKRDGQFLLFLWQEVDSTKSVTPVSATISFDNELMDVRSYNTVASTEPTYSGSGIGELAVGVGDSPVMLAFSPTPSSPGNDGSGAGSGSSGTNSNSSGNSATNQGSNKSSGTSSKQGNAAQPEPATVSDATNDPVVLPKNDPTSSPSNLEKVKGIGISLVIVGVLVLVSYAGSFMRASLWHGPV
ncbi:MAG: hypothetical protein HZB70_03605 [Candidatus Berkelbacteria bacterium]|nr:MAG: hypothetical protein HZB70_03605 [Candidatus Berkelbacteria bacterium]QQG51613.1 MAG: hypothetical protein HY845_03585 [Candidatus Berkelbacteria bacterium]